MQYSVPCTVPEWEAKWTQKAAVELYFDTQHIAYKGPEGGNVVTFMEAVTSFSLYPGSGVEQSVHVHGVGFDVREKYNCIFKVKELGDDTSFRGPSKSV